MDDEDAEYARAAMLEAVETQIRDGEPPEASEALNQLLVDGCSRDEAIRLIASAFATEMFEMMKQQREHDPAHYAEVLNRLPRLPWE